MCMENVPRGSTRKIIIFYERISIPITRDRCVPTIPTYICIGAAGEYISI